MLRKRKVVKNMDFSWNARQDSNLRPSDSWSVGFGMAAISPYAINSCNSNIIQESAIRLKAVIILGVDFLMVTDNCPSPKASFIPEIEKLTRFT